ICEKAGKKAGFLIWLPILQLFPLLRAARMSPAWFLVCLLPLINLVPLVAWCLRIAKACGKSQWLGILLLFPVTTLFALLYLAFANGGQVKKEEKPPVEIMTL